MPEVQARRLQEWERLHLIHCTRCSLDIHEMTFREPERQVEHPIERAPKPEDIEC